MRIAPLPTLLLALVLAGCATGSGPTGSLPSIPDAGHSAEVVVIRTNSILGKILNATVSYNGKDLLALKAGQYTRFRIPADEYNREASVAARFPDERGWGQVNLLCSPGATYYVLIDAGNRTSFVMEVSAADAEERIGRSKYVVVDAAMPSPR